MQYSRCKCGETEFFGSGMSPQPCQVCDKCGSVPADHPDRHPDPVPHDFKWHWMQGTGKNPVREQICMRCMARGERQEVEISGIE